MECSLFQLPIVNLPARGQGHFVEDENFFWTRMPWEVTLGEGVKKALLELLALDSRPAYHDDPERVYGVRYAEWDVKFTMEGEMVRVRGVEREKISTEIGFSTYGR